MNNTMKEIQENPLIDSIMRDSLKVNMVAFGVFCHSISKHWEEKMPIMTCEECGELIQAISKYERNDGDGQSTEDLINEMGDVIISIFTLASKYHISYRDIISRCYLKSSSTFIFDESKK